MVRGVIIGTGSCTPKRAMSNADMEKIVDTSDEWISTRTGIKSRYIAQAGEETSKLASEAARRAMEMALVKPEEIDLIVVATISSEIAMPSCACLVQKEIGAVNAFAFDLNAACCGFTYAYDLADKYVRANRDMKILVIGAETLSTRTNWQDRNSCVLWGDGAGACVITGKDDGSGLLNSRLFSDGRLWDLLYMEGPASMNSDLDRPDKAGPYIQMAGRDVFKHAVRALGEAVCQVMDDKKVTVNDLTWVIPHQANIRIIQSVIDRIDVPKEKVYVNIHKYGNTSAASIPIALDEANRQGILKKDDLILLCTFGAGFTWGAALLQW